MSKLSEITFTDAELALIHRIACRGGSFKEAFFADQVLPSLRAFLAGEAGKNGARRHDLLTKARCGAPNSWDIERVALAFTASAKAVVAARDPKKLKCFFGNLDGRREAVVAATTEQTAAYALDIGLGHFKGYFSKTGKPNPVAIAKPFTVFVRSIDPIRSNDDPSDLTELA